MARQALRARTAFIIASAKGGIPHSVSEGQVFMSDDPIIHSVKGNVLLFEPFDEVEQATAAPGEKRAVRIPKPKVPKPKVVKAASQRKKVPNG